MPLLWLFRVQSDLAYNADVHDETLRQVEFEFMEEISAMKVRC